jgi:hypothetical protein
MKSVGVFAATYLAHNQFVKGQTQIEAGHEQDNTMAADQHVVEAPRRRPSARRWLRAVRGTAAA